jgi:hypothetical protein
VGVESFKKSAREAKKGKLHHPNSFFNFSTCFLFDFLSNIQNKPYYKAMAKNLFDNERLHHYINKTHIFYTFEKRHVNRVHSVGLFFMFGPNSLSLESSC